MHFNKDVVFCGVSLFCICFKWANPRGDMLSFAGDETGSKRGNPLSLCHYICTQRAFLERASSDAAALERSGSPREERRNPVRFQTDIWLISGAESVCGGSELALERSGRRRRSRVEQRRQDFHGSEVRSDTRGLLYYKRRTRRSTLHREPEEEDAVHVTAGTVQHPRERIWGVEAHFLWHVWIRLTAAWLALLSVCKWSSGPPGHWKFSDSGWGLISVFATWCPLQPISGGFQSRTCDWSFLINVRDPAPDLCSERRTCAAPPSPACRRVFVILMSL